MVAIKVGGTLEYQKELFGILNMIDKNPIGKVIVGFVLKHKKLVRIDPLMGAELKKAKEAASEGDDHANTYPVKPADSGPKGASEQGPNYWYRGDPDSPYTRREDERFDKVRHGLVGTGAGSNTLITFSPELIKTNRTWDRRVDNVLVHELVHALRDMQGLRNPVPTKDSNWKNEEEFLAVAVQNVYLSAGGSARLRGGYVYETLLEAPDDTSSGFLTASNREIFDKHTTSWGQVYTELALVNTARFNPFREFVHGKL